MNISVMVLSIIVKHFGIIIMLNKVFDDDNAEEDDENLENQEDSEENNVDETVIVENDIDKKLEEALRSFGLCQ